MDMDTLYLYEETCEDSFKSKQNCNATTIGDHRNHTPSVEELDPTLELTVDLQGLIQQAHENATTPDLFPDLLPSTTLTELQNIPASVQNSLVKNIEPQLVAELLTPGDSNDSSQMPHLEWLQDNQFVVVKPDPENHQPPTTIDLNALFAGSESVAKDNSATYPHHTTTASSPVGSGVTIAEATSSFASPLASPISPQAHSPSALSPSDPYPQSKYTFKAVPPSKSGRGRRVLDKASNEYKDRRERNNVAVRKSRDKAKRRQVETEEKVQILTSENEKLQKKCDLLSKELTVLKGLFTNVGAAMPEEFKRQFEMLARK